MSRHNNDSVDDDGDDDDDDDDEDDEDYREGASDAENDDDDEDDEDDEFDEEEDADGNAIQVYYFPAAAIAYLEALDPREAVLVEVTPNPRRADQTPVRLLFEVGDFRAAHCFVLIPQPEGAPGGQG